MKFNRFNAKTDTKAGDGNSGNGDFTKEHARVNPCAWLGVFKKKFVESGRNAYIFISSSCYGELEGAAIA